FPIRARQVLNATGPWVDAVCRLAGEGSWPRLRPTKGAHLVLPDRGLTAAFLLLHPQDGRGFFVIPWLGKNLVGTTDTACDDSPEALTVTAVDRSYLLEGYNHYLNPAAGAGDVLGQFVGLRPLVRFRAGAPSALSREFYVFESPGGLLSVAGGKYTTYRHMAEVITDTVTRKLRRWRPCPTRQFKLEGAPKVPWE